MNEEYPTADYCYCDKCVADFKAESGIDIKAVEDPSTCEEWKQFRYNRITNLVNKIAAAVHAKGKKSVQLYSPVRILMQRNWFVRNGINGISMPSSR